MVVRSFIFVLAFWAAGLILPSTVEAQDKVTIAAGQDFRPFEFVDEKGDPQGLVIDLWKLWSEKTGIPVEFAPASWAETQEMVKDGRVSVHAGLNVSEKRRQFLDYGDSLISTNSYVFSPNGIDISGSLQELAGFRVGVLKGSLEEALISERVPGAKLVSFETIDGLYDAIAAKKIRLFADVEQTALYFLSQRNISRDFHFDPSTPLDANHLFAAVTKGQTALLKKLNAGLRLITADEKAEIERRWISNQGKRLFGPAASSKINGVDIGLTDEERTWLVQHQTIRLGVDPAFPPFEFIGKGGHYLGMASDYLTVISERLGIDMKVIPGLTWTQVIEKIKKREIDVLPVVGTSQERRGYLSFSQPHITFPVTFWTHKSHPPVMAFDDLSGQKLAMVKGYYYVDEITKKYPSIQPYFVETPLEALNALSTGKADAFIVNLAVANYLIQKNNIVNLRLDSVADLTPSGSGFGFGVRKDWPEFVTILDKVLDTISPEQHNEIQKKWGVISEENKGKSPNIKLTEEERAWIKTHPRVRVHNEMAWPPFNYAKDGAPQGFSIDFMNLLAKKTGLEVEYITGPSWNEFLEMMKSRELDVMLNIVKTPEREDYLLYTPSYANNPNTILSHRNTVYKSAEQLFGKTVAVPKGFFYEEILKRDFPQIKILAVKDMLESMKAVSFGNADAAFGELAVFDHLITQHIMTDLVVAGDLDWGNPELTLLNIATHKDLPILASILTKGVNAITKEEKREIQKLWFEGAAKTDQLALPERAAFNQTDFILQYMAIIFSLILAVVFAMWVARGRRKQLTIRELLFVIFFIFVGLIVSIGTLVTMLLEGEQEQSLIEARNNEAFSLGLELKQSSDDLTRFARTFSVTGDPAYEQYYQSIIAIRDGKRARPREYTRSYWDQVVAGVVALDQDGEIFSIEQKMLELGITKDEQQKLSQAKQLSDTLVNLELTAMNAVYGRFKDSNGAFTVEGKPNLEMASQLLFGKDYLNAKARIMKPIDDFFILLEWRTTNELNHVREQNKAIILAITILTVITIGFAVSAFFILKRRVISPLSELEAGALNLRDGDYSCRVDIASKDEIGTLARSFNAMANGIEDRTNEVAEKERQLRLAMDNMPGGMLLVDRDQNFVLFNRLYSELFDFPNDLIAEGRPLVDMIHFQAQRGDYGSGRFVKVVSETMHLFRSEKPHHYERSIPNGRILDVDLSPTPDGGTVAVVTDITERKKYELDLKNNRNDLERLVVDLEQSRIQLEEQASALAELAEEQGTLREKAEDATRSKAAFLAAMSHEIRTPMNGVIGMISLLQEGQLESDQRTMMNTVQDSAFSLLQIINDILDFSKIEAGKMSLEKIPVDIDTVMEGVTETLLPNVSKKDLRMALLTDPDIPDHVMTDQVRLRQILFNLAGNAAKFTENTPERQGVVKLRAELTEPVKDGCARVRFSVMDNGIGMSPKAVKKLFTPFAQADETTTRRFGGTGLGLSICKTLTDLMGGEIAVESTEGEGSAFHVTLPFDVAEQAGDQARAFDLSGLNIAYAVKRDDTAEAVERYASAGGAKVTRFPVADIAANVVAHAKNNPFDIVVLGALDGGRDRESIIETLRADENRPGPNFVLLTDNPSEQRGMILPDKVVVQCAPVRKTGFMHGVAMAAGRASPEIENEAPKLSAGARKAPTVDEAREAGELILVAEDNPTNQDVIRRQLNVLGYACEMADDGVIALDMLQNCDYAMLLTDCHMPNMDGYELTGAVRDLEQNVDKRLPVIAITANALQDAVDQCLASGMDDYLPKPLEMDKLKAMLAKWLPVEHGNSTSEPEAAPAVEKTVDDGSSDVAVNVKALTDIFGEDKGLLKEILGDYVQPSSDIIVEIDTGYEAHDADAVGKAGHKLKSSSRAIGADALADLCNALEGAGKARNWKEIERLYPNLHPTFDAVIKFINDL